MRMHITLEDDLVVRLDRRVGRRRRSAFIAATLRTALEDQQRWDDVEAGLGALASNRHDWDENPAAWVKAQRQGDAGRVG